MNPARHTQLRLALALALGLCLLLLWLGRRPPAPAQAPPIQPAIAQLAPSRASAQPALEPSTLDSSAALEAEHEGQRRALEAAAAPGRLRPQKLTGRVLDRAGAQLPKARVVLHRLGSAANEDECTSDDEGRFVLRYLAAGEYEIAALQRGTGVSAPTTLRLESNPPAEPLELSIREPDFLAGRLADLEGRALPGAELWAFPARYSAADPHWLFGWRNRPAARTLRGESSGQCVTDAQGRFRFEGLAPGAYFVARREELDPPHDARWLHSTGETDVELVERRAWLRLVTPGAAGMLAFCAPLSSAGPSDALLEPVEKRDDGVLFEVEPCRVYRCGFLDAQHGLVEEELAIPCRGGTVERELRLPARESGGTLVLDMPEFGRKSGTPARRVRVRSAASGVLVWSWTQLGHEEAGLPAGRFVLEVAEPPARRPEILLRADPLGEALLTRQPFEIRAGERTRIEVRD